MTTNLHVRFVRLEEHGDLHSDQPILVTRRPDEGGDAARVRDPDGITIALVKLPAGGPHH
jgi:hypothetical protein